jgi:catechol 2,3-dioxygenase-like lactoylglutathione lyase family enzyme
MGKLKIEGLTHWSIAVNDLEESKAFYGDLLGLEGVGPLGTGMYRFLTGDSSLLLYQRETPRDPVEAEGMHHSFTVTPATLVEACKVFAARELQIQALVYRAKGHFIGRELYFADPSGNRLEFRDPTWQPGMPEPSYEEIVAS